MHFGVTKLLHLAFCASIFLFACVVIALKIEEASFDFEFGQNTAIYVVFPILAIVSMLISPLFFKNYIASGDKLATPPEKLNRYMTGFIVMCAFLEAGALANLVGLLITGNLLFLFFAGGCLVMLITNVPTKNKVANLLNLQQEDLL